MTATEPASLDPASLDPMQLDVAAPAVPTLATLAVGEDTRPPSTPVAPTRSGAASTEQLTMELAPADQPHVEPAHSCPLCGTVAAVSDTFCETCGLQLTNDRDHYSEQPARWVAAVTDVGVRHHHNEDASAVAADESDGWAVAVVCDGVSSAQESDLASLVAARAARDRLRPEPTEHPDSRHGHQQLADLMVEAAREAHQAALRQTTAGTGASCTFAAAFVQRDVIASVAIGDSRIYWIPEPVSPADPDSGETGGRSDWDRPQLLSTDDSLAELRVAAGADRAQAEQASDAHVITGWIGQNAPEPDPRPLLVRPDRPGWLLVCTDGLWNYVSEPEALAALVSELGADLRPGALALGDALVRWAVDQGGKDNVTVAVCRVPFAPETRPAGTPESN